MAPSRTLQGKTSAFLTMTHGVNINSGIMRYTEYRTPRWVCLSSFDEFASRPWVQHTRCLVISKKGIVMMAKRRKENVFLCIKPAATVAQMTKNGCLCFGLLVPHTRRENAGYEKRGIISARHSLVSIRLHARGGMGVMHD